jgi:hypothetical protein
MGLRLAQGLTAATLAPIAELEKPGLGTLGMSKVCT